MKKDIVRFMAVTLIIVATASTFTGMRPAYSVDQAWVRYVRGNPDSIGSYEPKAFTADDYKAVDSCAVPADQVCAAKFTRGVHGEPTGTPVQIISGTTPVLSR